MFRITSTATAARRIATQVRYTSSGKEGSVAQDKAFAEKERSQETVYVRQHEAAQLAKLRAQMLQAQKSIEESKSELNKTQAALKDLESRSKEQ